MKSLTILLNSWKSVALDFVIKLSLSKDLLTGVEYDSILIIIDRLTKYTYMILYIEASTTEQMAFTFIRWIIV